MNRRQRRGTDRPFQALRAWGFSHAQCAFASLGSLWRAPAATALTTAVIGVALALPAAAYMAMDGLLEVGARFSHTGDVSAFLRMEVDDARGAELVGELASTQGISTVRLITKAQALEEFRAAAEMGYDLDNLGGSNPLPAVLAVTPAAQSAEAVESLSARLAALPEVEFVQADREWLLRLEAIMEVANHSLWILACLLGAGIVLVVGNTLRLSIEARRVEVEVAKLFGASDAFVRRPFLYHGLFYGLLGALVAGVLLLGAALLLKPALQRLAEVYSEDISIGAPDQAILLVLSLVLTGGCLGLLGAWLCVGHHLRRVEPR